MGRRDLVGRNNRRDLSRAMDSCRQDLSTAEEIVDDLRSRYGKYARMPRQSLVLNIRRVLDAQNNNNKKKRVKEEEEDDNNSDDDDDQGTGGGKMKKQRREQSNVERRNKEKSVSSSSWEDSGGHISTSEDPSFNFTSDTLRGGYGEMNSSTKLARVSPPLPLLSGESEENIRELFSKAYRTAPSIVFIDEIDAIGSKRENQQREMEKRIVTQLLTCMDGPPPGDTEAGYVVVIGATNTPDALDPALRRGRRFGREIALTAPDEHARAEILSLVAQRLRLEGSFDMKRIARLTPGFVGADLEELADMAASLCVKRIMDSRKLQLSDDDRSWLSQPWAEEDLDKLFVRMSDFEEAVKLVKGSLTREGFSTVPDVTWGDVGGLDHLRTQLKDYVVNPIKYPETFEKFGGKLNLETGFLLYGPPGCGKTLVAKAVANEAGANFIHIKGPELLNKYLGESERAIRTLFQRARTSAPCVIFFDEVDALTGRRGREGDLVVGGLLNQFLTELHGGDRRDVYVIGATNRIDVIDPAFLRPGRFGNRVYVPLPNADDRVSILKSIAKKRPIDPSVDLDAIANKYCEGFSGADLANLMDQAIHVAVKEKFQSIESSEYGDMDFSDCTIKMTHFKQALSLVTPSVSKQQIKHYEEQRKKYQSSTGRNNMDQINLGPAFALE
ncbi:AAA ATPase [Hirschfeldia incana]|nr:AAA ATPase [Hirschfeldia incana]